ncbi:MAG TPA: hypothetical protein PLN01_10765, partial [Spirochaetota bacterium]|nr:hypothetical protein [Spirochaetota bacterium]
MNPPLSHQAEHSLYDEGYYTGSSDYSYYDERKTERYSQYVWNARLQTIHNYVRGGNFLDVGCSFGGFLHAASQLYTPYGIEPSAYSGKYAQKRF